MNSDNRGTGMVKLEDLKAACDGMVAIENDPFDKQEALDAWDELISNNPVVLSAIINEVLATRAFDAYDKSKALNEREHVRNFYCLKSDRDKARERTDAILRGEL